MKDFPVANGSNIRAVEREQCNGATFSSHKLDFESCTIFVAVHHGPYVALSQTVLGDVIREDDRV